MTERELEQRLRGFYQAGVEAAGRVPTELREGVWDIPDEVPIKRGLFGSQRTVLLFAAAMLLALLVGTAIVVGSGLIPWLDDESNPELVPPALSWGGQLQTNVDAGTYFMDIPTDLTSTPRTIRVTFTLPIGWERVAAPLLLWGQTKWVGFGVFDSRYSRYVYPCYPDRGGALPLVATPADIADGLATLPLFQATSAIPTTFGGYSGMMVELTRPADPAGCPGADMWFFRNLGLYGEDQPVRMLILDVEGVLLVITGAYDAAASEGDRAELQEVIDSIKIDPPAR
jgi:hypothetical protein